MAYPTAYPIECNIPVQVKVRKTPVRPSKNGRAPFATLEVGNSFFAPLATTKCKSLESLKHSLEVRAFHFPAMRFTFLVDVKAKGVRCWRVA